MMRRTFRLALGLFILAQCAVFAAEQPAATKADASMLKAVAQDPRLDQKLTYKCDRKRLDKVLPEIGKLTGVRMGVDPGKRFWPVRQRKVTLFLKDMPLRQFMDQLEALLDYHFTRQGETGKWTYVLWQDVKGRGREQDTLKEQQALRLYHRRRAVEETLRDAEFALMMTPEQGKAMEKTNPWLAYLAGTPRGRAFSELLKTIPSEKFDMLVTGDKEHSGFYLRLSELPRGAQDALKKIESLVDKNKLKQDHPEHEIGEVTGIWVNDQSAWHNDEEPTPAIPFFVTVRCDPGDVIDTFAITRSDVPMGEPREWSTSWSEDERRARETLAVAQRAAMPANGATGAGAGSPKPDPDLELVAEYTGKEHAKDQSQIGYELEQLADLFGLSVLYESYPLGDRGSSTYAGERRLGAAMDDIASKFRVEWTKTGKTLRFRHLDWAERRSWEVPDEWVNTWLRNIQQKQEADLDTLADIATKLTDVQMDHAFGMDSSGLDSSIDDPLVARVFQAAGASRMKYQLKLFQLYGRLTPTRKKMMWSDTGLPYDEIADDPLFNGQVPSIGPTPIYDASLKLSRKTDPATQEEAVFMSMKVRVWLKDLSPDDRRSIAPRLTQEDLAKADTEPVELGKGEDHAWIPSNRKQVKSALDELRKAKEKAAEQKVSDGTLRT